MDMLCREGEGGSEMVAGEVQEWRMMEERK